MAPALLVKSQSVLPRGAKVAGPPLFSPRFLIFLPYEFVNKTLSRGQTVLIVSLWPKANDSSNLRRKTGPISECFGLKVAGVCQHRQEHTHSLCIPSWVYTFWIVWLWIGCAEDSKAQLLGHFLEETSCSLHGGSILHVRISLHVLQCSYSILHIKMHCHVEAIPNCR